MATGFETFSTALEWIAKDKLHASSIIHILDDFLFIALAETKCQVDLDNFLCMCRRIGILIADDKTMGPTTALQFAGITLDINEGSSSRGQACQMLYPFG